MSDFEKRWEFKGLECAVVMITRGQDAHHRCGYVKINDDHICYGEEMGMFNVDVNGGVTYARNHLLDDETGWWVGFDCMHAWDAPDPSQNNDSGRSEGCRFWELNSVFKETEKLADHLIRLE